MIFRARQFKFAFPRPVLVMGIVNVTPDSFSDGGKFLNINAAVQHALQLVKQGAEILDIGGESTRPDAKPVSEKKELRRVIPVIEKLAAKIKIPISIDTMKPAVARAALKAGASIVNDVAANRDDGEMWKIVSEFRAGYICMHAPPSLHKIERQKNMVAEVGKFFRERLKKLNAHGISSDQAVFDVGIGFGKTIDQNLRLLASLERFKKLKRPMLLGVSRKSFIGKLFDANVNERLPASLACAILAIESGAQIIRAHDVAETVQAVRMAEAVMATK
ncbi:MAG TPA: dihydropteroate synthase [Candidatus Baltobacteraceae bacterium]|nr:dihydropteroate synthase [Candidatus Baltobacteraceae bacterium]